MISVHMLSFQVVIDVQPRWKMGLRGPQNHRRGEHELQIGRELFADPFADRQSEHRPHRQHKQGNCGSGADPEPAGEIDEFVAGFVRMDRSSAPAPCRRSGRRPGRPGRFPGASGRCTARLGCTTFLRWRHAGQIEIRVGLEPVVTGLRTKMEGSPAKSAIWCRPVARWSCRKPDRALSLRLPGWWRRRGARGDGRGAADVPSGWYPLLEGRKPNIWIPVTGGSRGKSWCACRICYLTLNAVTFHSIGIRLRRHVMKLNVPDVCRGHCKASIEKAIAGIDSDARVTVDFGCQDGRGSDSAGQRPDCPGHSGRRVRGAGDMTASHRSIPI